MNLIVAVSKNWGIGCENRLLFCIREDLQRFKQITTGKTVVMGHNTFRSLPGGKPLPNRENIVLSRDKNLQIDGVIVCNSTDALLQLLEGRPCEDIFIIGGENVYTQFLPLCKCAIITKVNVAPPADAFMPNLDEHPDWQLSEESAPQFCGEISYTYCEYIRV